jgi:phosphate-selective porin
MSRLVKFSVMCIITIIFCFSAVSDLIAGLKVYEKDDVSLEISGRIQTRFQWINDGKNNSDDVYDFYLRRTRFGFAAKYRETISGKLQWKLDNLEKFGEDEPILKAKMAFVRFDFFNQKLMFDLGLNEGVFSRESRLPDPKHLFTEFSLIQRALNSFELAGDTSGVHITGKLMDRHLEYGVGVYDGIDNEGDSDDDLAYQLALVYHVLDVESSKQGSHIGDGKTYLTVGAYYGIQNDVAEDLDLFDAHAYGLDVFVQVGDQPVPGTFTASGGYFIIKEEFNNKGDFDNDGYYIEGAYLMPRKIGSGKLRGNLEFAVRYGEYNPEEGSNTFDDEQDRLSLGLNYYIIKHNVKVQAVYNINDSDRDESKDKDDFTVQVQFAI